MNDADKALLAAGIFWAMSEHLLRSASKTNNGSARQKIIEGFRAQMNAGMPFELRSQEEIEFVERLLDDLAAGRPLNFEFGSLS